jgi:hypothetical protein
MAGSAPLALSASRRARHALQPCRVKLSGQAFKAYSDTDQLDLDLLLRLRDVWREDVIDTRQLAWR